MPRVVLVKSPFYSLVGSHNNKVPVELSYYAAYFMAAGWDALIYNGDASPATKHFTWRQLMERTDLLVNAVEGRADGMLLSVVESVLSLNPDVVIVANDDTFMPSVCNDMPFLAARLAFHFRQRGVYTVGVGTFWQLDKALTYGLDLVTAGTPNSQLVNAVAERSGGVANLGREFEDVLPVVVADRMLPKGLPHDYSYLVTTRGCSFPCSFCYNTKVANRFQERSIPNVMTDLERRICVGGGERFYFTDQIFNRNVPRLKALGDALYAVFGEETPKFTAEGRSELLNKFPETAQLMSRIGVDYVKLGVENVGAQFNKGMKKNQVSDGIVTAVQYLRDAGIRVGAYLMLGGDTTHAEYLQTLEFCKEIDFDGYIISVLSQPMSELGSLSYQYDTHFSLARAGEYDLTPEIVDAYLDLQESKSGNRDLQMLT